MELEVTLKYTVNLHNIRFTGEDPREPSDAELAKFEEELSGEAYELALECHLKGWGLLQGTLSMYDQWLVDWTVNPDGMA